MRTAEQASVVCAHAVNEVAVLYVHMQHSTHCAQAVNEVSVTVLYAHMQLMRLHLGAIQCGSWEQF